MAVRSSASPVWTGASIDAKIAVMARKPEDKYKVQAPSLPEIAAAFDELHGPLRSRVRFQGSVLTRGALINAVMIHFLSLDADAQRRIVETGVTRYEEMLESDGEMEDWRIAPVPGLVEPVAAPVDRGVRGGGGVEYIGDHGGLGSDTLPEADDERPRRAKKPARRR